jgi:hypothetical protein
MRAPRKMVAKKPALAPPPTDDEFDEDLCTLERSHPSVRAHPKLRAAEIRKFIRSIKENPDDIRNTPDVRPAKGGGTYVSKVTDVDDILGHCDRVTRLDEAGKLSLARMSCLDLDARVRAVEKRGRGPQRGGKKGAEARWGGHDDDLAKIAAHFDRELRKLKDQGSARPKSVATENTADRFRVSESTVLRARNKFVNNSH